MAPFEALEAPVARFDEISLEDVQRFHQKTVHIGYADPLSLSQARLAKGVVARSTGWPWRSLFVPPLSFQPYDKIKQIASLRATLNGSPIVVSGGYQFL
jgi:hypothetical protein